MPIVLMNLQKIPKALSIPNRKSVFAQDIVLSVINSIDVDDKYNLNNYILSTLNKYFNEIDVNINENKIFIDFIKKDYPEIWKKIFNGLNLENNEEIICSTGSQYWYDFSSSRRSIRNFLQTPIDISVLFEALKSCVFYPSACNRQPCSLVLIKEEEIKKEILNMHQGSAGFSAPHLFAVVVDNSAFFQNNESEAASFHAGMFTQQTILSLHDKGIGSCILNWHVSDDVDEKTKKLLHLKEEEKISCLIYVGYPDKSKKEAVSYKKTFDNILKIVE